MGTAWHPINANFCFPNSSQHTHVRRGGNLEPGETAPSER